ncbi:ABC transporter permease [Melioribacteraceae bacterium 4301-Me]|uniref:ABC transporter permease n=1 Tax=Pyranulibacter aquaticus TaxID=3163344 RepID=UPI003598E17A
MLTRIFAIAKKEIRQLKRDKRMLYVLFIWPFILLILFGYAINFDVHHIKTVVYDLDKSEDSRYFINMLTSSNYFDVVGYIDSEKKINEVIDANIARIVIVFPEDFSKNIHSNRQAKIQILISAIDANTASIVSSYINAATATFSFKIVEEALAVKGGSPYIPVNLSPRFWFNPDLNSTLFLIPGLISMILIMTAVISIAMSIVREKEKGSIEQINVSPISSIELLIGKTMPYSVLSLIIASTILLACYILFGATIKGSILLLFVSTFIFLFASLNLGILISSISDSQQVAFQLSALITILPSFLLSGFVFPIESMPPAIQILTNITPVKFYIVILRDIMLKGVGIEAFWPQLIYLLIFSFFFLTVASIINRKNKVD